MVRYHQNLLMNLDQKKNVTLELKKLVSVSKKKIEVKIPHKNK